MVTMPSGKVFNFADSEGIILRLWKEPIKILLCENPLKYIEGITCLKWIFRERAV